MEQEKPVNKTTYEWVWKVTNVVELEQEKVPMQRGDAVYISIDANDNARFHHRSAGSDVNTGLWSKATGRYDASTGVVTGDLPDSTTFAMSITNAGKYHKISCKHRRNPDQGQWDGDDSVGD